MLKIKPVVKVEVEVEVPGGKVYRIGSDVLEILYEIYRGGSILYAAKRLGIAYSRVWERIARLEAQLGERVLNTRRGRGGTRLTALGLALVKAYREGHVNCYEVPTGETSVPFTPKLVYAGSDDFIVRKVLSRLSSEDVTVESYWIGSISGLASVVLREADVGGIHVIGDEGYNEWLVKEFARGYNVSYLYGYERSLGFATNQLSYRNIESVIRDLCRGRLRIANRVPGAGSRRLLEKLLIDSGCRDFMLIPGWGEEYSTHQDVLDALKKGEADVGVVAMHDALRYGLNYIHIVWERFDFVMNKTKHGRVFSRTLCEVIDEGLPEGYKAYRDSCRVEDL